MRKTIFLFIILFSAGCNSVNATKTPNQVISDSPTSTIVVIPTRTSIPTIAPSPTPEPLIESATISISPDKNWKIVGVTQWEPSAIVSQDGKTRWPLENTPNKYGWYQWSYGLYRWSIQPNFVYLTVNPQIDGFVPFYQGSGLYRFNLSNGAMIEILPGQELSSFSLSPNEKLLAYEAYSNSLLSLMIRDIGTNLEKKIPLDGYDSAGHILWSPDQEYLVFSISTGTDWTDWHVSLALANLQGLSTKILYNEQRVLNPKEWLNRNEILVSIDENFYVFNLTTKKLRDFVKPTPSQ